MRLLKRAGVPFYALDILNTVTSGACFASGAKKNRPLQSGDAKTELVVLLLCCFTS